MIRTLNDTDIDLFTWALHREAVDDTGVDVDFGSTVVPAIEAGEVIVVEHNEIPTAFLVFQQATLPDTGEQVLVERMLYAPRRAANAIRLMHHLEIIARAKKCTSILSGASLYGKEAARRIYERMGFQTNYTFKKEVQHV